MKFRLTAPGLQIDEEIEAANAFRAVEVVRLLVHKLGCIVLLNVQEPTHCQGLIYKDNGLELMPVGTVEAVAVLPA